jgi:signal transduction histidine kinase
MLPRSFRMRLLLGSVLWTLGLLALTHLVSMVVIVRVPAMRRVDHHVLLVIGGTLALIGLLQLRDSVQSFDHLRARLAAVREGRERRVAGEYPTEVQSLVDELNALLADREEKVARAVAKAGDLAHGLKTPLALLLEEAEHSPNVAQQVERMRRQIDYHLAHARAAASGATLGAHTSVLESAEGLVRTMQRLHAARNLAIEIDVPPEHAFRGEREDLDELLGNLLDNACKWAHSRVAVASSLDGGTIAITIDDDGAGIEPSMRERVLQRGVRADEAAPGSGFGLAIVRDLAELYGGSITLDESPLGGVRATLRLPAA